MLGAFACRIAGSSDLYAKSGKGPECSINFVTCHDGFTLNDLVSYERKHNDANGHDNRDGANENFSSNYGVEGETDVPAVEAVRQRQIKNFLLTLAVSRGVPMLLGGDEVRRTQRGNNNAYCQDNDTSWLNWSLRHRHDDILRFTRNVLAFRRDHPVLRRETFYTSEEIQWFDQHGHSPDWSDSRSRSLACLICGEDEPALYLMFNAEPEPLGFTLPVPPRPGLWRIAVDTAEPPSRDCHTVGEESALASQTSYAIGSRSSAILVAR
jgi:glycogen operon protein